MDDEEYVDPGIHDTHTQEEREQYVWKHFVKDENNVLLFGIEPIWQDANPDVQTNILTITLAESEHLLYDSDTGEPFEEWEPDVDEYSVVEIEEITLVCPENEDRNQVDIYCVKNESHSFTLDGHILTYDLEYHKDGTDLTKYHLPNGFIAETKVITHDKGIRRLDELVDEELIEIINKYGEYETAKVEKMNQAPVMIVALKRDEETMYFQCTYTHLWYVMESLDDKEEPDKWAIYETKDLETGMLIPYTQWHNREKEPWTIVSVKTSEDISATSHSGLKICNVQPKCECIDKNLMHECIEYCKCLRERKPRCYCANPAKERSCLNCMLCLRQCIKKMKCDCANHPDECGCSKLQYFGVSSICRRTLIDEFLMCPGMTKQIVIPDGQRYFTIKLWNKHPYKLIQGPETEMFDDHYKNWHMSLSRFNDLKKLERFIMFNSSVYDDTKYIRNIPKITYLDLNRTEIEGDVGNFGRLGSLERLFLHDCPKLGGDIGGLRLGGCVELDVGDTNVGGNISGLGSMRSLQQFDVAANEVYGDIAGIAGLANLTDFWFNDDNKIYGNLSALSGMTKLNRIYIQKTNIYGDTSSISGISGLGSLHLRDIDVTGKLEDFNDMANLTDLDLKSVNISGTFSVLPVYHIPLKMLAIYETLINGDIKDLAPLINLNLLYLYENDNIVGDIQYLSPLINLYWLVLSHIDVGGDVANLSGLNSLERLKLNYVDVYGDISNLSNFKTLKNLDVHTTKVTGDIGGLSGLGNLEQLWLYKSKVTGNVAGIGGLSKLLGLWLHKTNVYGNLSALRGLTALKTLHIFNTHIRGKKSDLANLLNLNIFNYGDNEDEVMYTWI